MFNCSKKQSCQKYEEQPPQKTTTSSSVENPKVAEAYDNALYAEGPATEEKLRL